MAGAEGCSQHNLLSLLRVANSLRGNEKSSVDELGMLLKVIRGAKIDNGQMSQ